jgi:hypothetical protein
MKTRNPYHPIIIFFILTIILFNCKKAEQSGNIRGTIKDAITNNPINGAVVTLNPGGKSPSTYNDGVYEFGNINIGSYTIQVEKDGYTLAQKTSIQVSEGSTTTADFLLEQKAIQITPTSYNAPATPTGNFKLTISSNQSWTASASHAWLTLSETTGSGNKEITVQYAENTTQNQRTGTVSVSAGGMTRICTIVQEAAAAPFLTIANNTYNPNSAAGNTSLALTSNVSWTAGSDQGWLSVSPSIGSNNQSMSISWGENTTTDLCTGHITFSGNGVASQTYTVNQESAVPGLPGIYTGMVLNITDNSAIVSGNLSSFGTSYSSVIQYGHCWSTTNQNPTISDDKTQLGTSSVTGNFQSNLNNLTPFTIYYVRAYATNGTGTNYGNTITFKTTLVNGLIAYFPFNGNVNDESGKGNNGTNNGASLTTDRNGNSNKAYSFNGTSSFIRTPCMINNPNAGTISFWYNLNSWNNTASNGSYLLYFMHVAGGEGFAIGTYPGWQNNLLFMIWTTTWNIANSTIIPTINSWTHIVCTWNNGTIKMYINNNLKVAYNYAGNLPTNMEYLFIGGCSVSNYGFVNGKIDDIRIFNREITVNDIQQLYNE